MWRRKIRSESRELRVEPECISAKTTCNVLKMKWGAGSIFSAWRQRLHRKVRGSPLEGLRSPAAQLHAVGVFLGKLIPVDAMVEAVGRVPAAPSTVLVSIPFARDVAGIGCWEQQQPSPVPERRRA